MVRPVQAADPVLEKVAAELCRQGRRLVKINVDKNKFIAAQFRVQSIPTVYAMFQGQPVADLTSARTEAQLGRCSTRY
jgi:putative thioredoxin